jgi:hypothetical protein
VTTLNYGALRKKAAEAGSGDGELLPVGEYDGEIIAAGAKAKAAGYSLWWKFKVLTGPEAGKVTFLNQQLNPDNGAQLDIFFRVVKDLGIDFDQVPDGTPPESVAKLALGRKFHFEIVHNPSKQDATKVFANFKNIKRLDAGVDTPAPPVVAPAAAAPTAPAAAAPTSELPF